MSESILRQLKILVERAVRPVRASTYIKRKMREELLAHVAAVFEEEVARLADEQAALERTAQRFGNPAELTGQFQESVPTLDAIVRLRERFADWMLFRPCEPMLRCALRYTIVVEVVALLLLIPMLLGLRRLMSWPTDALWHICPVLLCSGYLGFTIGIFESSMHRLLLCEQKRGSWLHFILVLVGSTIVSMTLGSLAYGVRLMTFIWAPLYTVWISVALAWGLAHESTARKRYHEEWASLPIE